MHDVGKILIRTETAAAFALAMLVLCVVGKRLILVSRADSNSPGRFKKANDWTFLDIRRCGEMSRTVSRNVSTRTSNQ